MTFGTTRVVGRQPYAPTAFTLGEIPGTHFQRLSRSQGTWFRREPRKRSAVTPPGIDPGISKLVAQCLNHYATPGPQIEYIYMYICIYIYILLNIIFLSPMARKSLRAGLECVWGRGLDLACWQYSGLSWLSGLFHYFNL